jgi:outer membrane receptor for ferrienterochelin and colicins
VLRGVRGFLISTDRNYSYAGVRGFDRTGDYNSTILLMVDGHRVNDNIYGQALLGTEGVVDMDLVERVEIVRGAGSSVYGSNAFFGVINLITRRGRDIGGVEGTALVGTGNGYGGRLTVGARIDGNSEYLLSVSAGHTDGDRRIAFPAFRDVNGGIAENSDSDRWLKALGKWRTGDFTLSAVYDSRTKQVPTAPFNAMFNDGRNETVDSRGWLEARYDGTVGGGSLTARAAVDVYHYSGNLVLGETPTTISQDRSKGSWWSAEVTYARPMAETLTLVAGAEWQSDLTNQQQTNNVVESPATFGFYSPVQFETAKLSYWGIYAQAEWRIAKGWDATLGVRHDDYASFGGVTNPRLALVHTTSPELTGKLIYGQAFRAPNVYEIYYNDGGVSQKMSQGLQPERISTSEALVDWAFAPNWRAVGAYYFNRITDLIRTVHDPADGLLVYQNSQSAIGRGLEGEVEGHTSFGLEMFATATMQLGTLAVTAPRTQVKGRIAQSFAGDRAVAALEAIYLASRRTLADTTIPAQTLTNLAVTAQKFWPGVRITAIVQNLFNVSLADPAGPEHRDDRIPSPERRFWLKLEFSF